MCWSTFVGQQRRIEKQKMGAVKKMRRRAALEGAEQRKESRKDESGGFLRMRWKFLNPVLASFSTNKHCRLANLHYCAV